ncbi:helix-turn-helix domain-containing protein [Rhodopseudomonas sp. B29]|uniref:helix-turn-helix domain-containing protein n=1 Tax=Rhodopseudomonas sp. B29 TaxID=95607 RepID=UPI0004CF87A7|nr:helix-turn-helix domain-containing protein [Rhodopseudomonas sp. B29]
MSETAADPSVIKQTLADLRAATAAVCDVTPLGPPEDFLVVSKAKLAGGWLLLESVGPPVRYDRTAAHVARGGLDHYQITLCLDGWMRFVVGRRDITLHPGDICLNDMAQPNFAELGGSDEKPSRVMTLVVPRQMLAPRLAHPDSVSGMMLAADDRRARLLSDQFNELWQQPDSDGSAGDTKTVVEVMCDLVAEAAGRSAHAHGANGRAERRLLLAAIKQHIDDHLESDAVSTEDIIRRFGVSRASLYRLFGPDGGVAHYVQDQRLNRALRLLIAPQARGARLINLALDLQFSGDSSFVRAFRRQFGMTPGEFRELSEAWLRKPAVDVGPGEMLNQLGEWN